MNSPSCKFLETSVIFLGSGASILEFFNSANLDFIAFAAIFCIFSSESAVVVSPSKSGKDNRIVLSSKYFATAI